MKMYVANCTPQAQDFVYRLPGRTAPTKQRIDVGHQVRISGELQPEDVNAIVDQHAMYGMVSAKDIDTSRQEITMIWSPDVIPVTRIRRAWDFNMEIKREKGRVQRRHAAVHIHNQLEGRAQHSGNEVEFKSVDVEIKEHKPSGGDGLREGHRLNRTIEGEGGFDPNTRGSTPVAKRRRKKSA